MHDYNPILVQFTSFHVCLCVVFVHLLKCNIIDVFCGFAFFMRLLLLNLNQKFDYQIHSTFHLPLYTLVVFKITDNSNRFLKCTLIRISTRNYPLHVSQMHMGVRVTFPDPVPCSEH